MRNYSITNNINNINDVYHFRSKVFEVVDKLSGQEILSSRLSCSISTHLTLLVKNEQNCTIETHVRMEHNQAILRFSFADGFNNNGLNDNSLNNNSNNAAKGRLANFFDTIEPHSQNKIHVEKRFVCIDNSEEAFLKIQEILAQKTKDELMLEVKNQHLELQLSFENLKKTTQEKTRMEDELNIAKDIQLSMLPLNFPAFPHRKDIADHAQLIPAKEEGGDFYDFYWLDDKHLGFVVGDVSGKGVPAALMMAVCKTLLKSRASADLSTASIMTHVNDEMARDNKNYMFVTVFMAILNTETGMLIYTNAGHNPTYIKKKNGSMVKLMDLHGPVVAAMEGMTYKETTTQIEVGDFIFCYTDGVTEAHNSNNELFTDKKLNDLLEHHSFSSTKQMVCDIVDATLEFTGEAEQFDDITALSIEYKTTYHG